MSLDGTSDACMAHMGFVRSGMGLPEVLVTRPATYPRSMRQPTAHVQQDTTASVTHHPHIPQGQTLHLQVGATGPLV